tara:strand:- start:96 stop:416 length:321 start_codon:yes stop_codon:yes gene_type:complete
MPKPNESHTLAELKTYVRNHKLNKGEVPLSLNKAAMVKRLKLVNHWDHKYAQRQALMRGGDRPPMKADKPRRGAQILARAKAMKAKREKPKSKLDKGQKDFLKGIY